MFSYGFQPWAALTGQQILEAIDEPNFQVIILLYFFYTYLFIVLKSLFSHFRDWNNQIVVPKNILMSWLNVGNMMLQNDPDLEI